MGEFEDSINLDSTYDDKIVEINEGCHGLSELENLVKQVDEPELGMSFDTADEAYKYYNEYARKIGFSVRKQRTNMSKVDREKIIRQMLVCSCEGIYQKIKTPQKQREIRRFDCKAMFEFKLSGDKYNVIKFISEHSHDLVPSQCAHYLKSQRKIEFS